MKHIFLYLAIASSVLFPMTAYTKTVYVSDQLETNLRSGPSIEYRIIRTIRSGDILKELESSQGFTRVETATGTKGWLLTRYLMDEPHPRIQLDELADIVQIRQQLEGKLAETTAQVTQLTNENDQLKVELEQISRTAANTIAINKQNEELQLHRINLEREVQSLQQIKSSLERSHNHRWFYAGAGVLLLGLILGLVIPKIRIYQRSNWNSL